MILSRILDLLAEQQTATLDEIARAVGSPSPAVRSMLETLQRKGLVHRLDMQPGCGSRCRRCAPGEVEVFASGPAGDTPPPADGSARRCGI
ncbi:MAG: FeoC-like transcriptional regulator [Sedimenticolaceae bacterium]